MREQAGLNRVVLITGTSTGIGLATAVGAARAGWTTVATMRDPGRAGGLRAAAAEAGIELDIRSLDVTERDSIGRCVEEVVAEYGGLDAVVNNAGAAHVGTIEVDGIEKVRAVMEVNFFGVVAVSEAVLPHLRARRGRLLTVTSIGGILGQPFNEAYCAAKFAVEGFMESLAPVVAAQGVRVSVIEPGPVATELLNNSGLDAPAAVAAAGPYADTLRAYLSLMAGDAGSAGQTAREAAVAILDTLNADDPAFRVQTSEFARKMTSRKLIDVDGSAIQRLTSRWIAG
jgi:NAD(P)-dependent dehydrogenase (short-subunit alcohol dehydrogenase family)